MLGAVDSANNTITPMTRASSVEDAVRKAIIALKGKAPKTINWNDEPKWYNPTVVSDLWAKCGISDSASVAKAHGLRITSIELLRVARNFYAHRNEDTRQKFETQLLTCGYPITGHPSTTLLNRPITARRTVLEDLLVDIEAIGQELCN
jgi:hypothetical protein